MELGSEVEDPPPEFVFLQEKVRNRARMAKDIGYFFITLSFSAFNGSKIVN